MIKAGIVPDMIGPDILEPKAVTTDGHGFWLRCYIGIYNVRDVWPCTECLGTLPGIGCWENRAVRR